MLAGSPRRQLAATRSDQAAVSAIKAFKCAMSAILQRRVLSGPILSDWRVLLDYLHTTMAFGTIEAVRVLHLNTQNRLMLDDLVAKGSADRATLHVRQVIARALEVGSSSIILAHNHPSGDPTPSRSDIEITRAIIDAGRTIGLAVHDHIVIGSSGHVSLRARHLI